MSDDEKVISLDAYRGVERSEDGIKVYAKDGDFVRALRWVTSLKGPDAEIEQALQDFATKQDQASTDRLRQLIFSTMVVFKERGQ